MSHHSPEHRDLLVAAGVCICVLLASSIRTISVHIPAPSHGFDVVGASATVPSAAPALAVVGFASCNKHTREQGYWETVGRALSRSHTQPIDAFAWMGDVVYADTPTPHGWIAAAPHEMRAKYDAFKQSENYARFRALLRRPPTGVWDDHDMGMNDGGREFVHRDAAQDIYLDFLGVAHNATRRARHGVYHVEAVPFGSGVELPSSLRRFDHAVCLLLLDARSSRDRTGSNGDMLGSEQWRWLDQTLRDPALEIGQRAAPCDDGACGASLFDRCAFTAIVSGVQITGDEKPTEHWGNFPASRVRLLELLHRHQARRFAFLSGDVHYAEVQHVALPLAFATPLVEITSSGLTHSLADVGLDPWVFDFLNRNHRRSGRFLGRSFGSITIISDAPGPQAVVAVHDVATGDIVLRHAFDLRESDAMVPVRSPRCGTACEIPVQSALSKTFFTAVDRYWPFGAVDMATKHRLLEGAARALRAVLPMPRSSPERSSPA